MPHSVACNKVAILDITRYLYIYLELALRDQQNGGQSFNLRARIVKLWRFKARKVDKIKEDDCLAFLSLFYGERVSSDAAKNGTIFSSN